MSKIHPTTNLLSSNHPSIIKLNKHLSQIKSSSDLLKQLLIESDPWLKSVEFQRQNLRNHYLNLVFPSYLIQSQTAKKYSIESLNLLWLDTSHALINIYRKRLNLIDQELKENRKLLKQNRHQNSNHNFSHPQSLIGPVARRKFLHQFQTFLNSEDQFWKYLINRIIHEYQLDNAKSCLKPLKISINSFNENSTNNLHQSYWDHQHSLARDQNQDVSSSVPEHDANIKLSSSNGLILVHKALICFGDLIRYSELYNQSTQPKNSQNLSSTSSSKSNQHPPYSRIVHQPDWSKAHECYNQARLLIPTNGNPSNQLAVLSSYVPDILSCAYHYYRALSVKNPFPTARQNLRLTFTKALEKWLNDKSAQDHSVSNCLTDNLKPSADTTLSRLQSKYVALHAMLHIKTLDMFVQTNNDFCRELVEHLKNKILPPELILKMTVTCMAAVWNERMDESRPRQSPSATNALPSFNNDLLIVKPLATVHLLHFIACLFSVVTTELGSIDGSLVESDLSQNISAVLRRILPALRIISKWILSGHMDDIHKIRVTLASVPLCTSIDHLATAECKFWAEYKNFIKSLKKCFPIGKLPNLDLTVKLEEDVELTGFLPIKKGIAMSLSSRTRRLSEGTISIKALHPNEEHLIRLRDLQKDARLIVIKYLSKKPANTSRPAPTSIDATEPKSNPTHLLDQQLLDSDRTSTANENSVDHRLIEPNNQESNILNIPQTNERFSAPHFACSDIDFQTSLDVHNQTQVDSFEKNTDWMDDEDPVELAMRVVVAQQIYGDDSKHEDESELKNIASVDLDEDDDDDEILYPLSRQNIENKLLKHHSDHSSSAYQSSANHFAHSLKVQNELPPPNEELRTAADLLASITRKPSLNRIQIPLASSTPDPPVSPSGWSSVLMLNRFGCKDQVPSSHSTPLGHGRRPPSVSLPKPAEGSPNVNIWSRSSLSSNLFSNQSEIAQNLVRSSAKVQLKEEALNQKSESNQL
ncbi:hypothetical protein O181_008534 [Austropuccinia psidii MF-1]|uniref:DNA/RNA-binding domain-containing protein n=1 Tax=Austropuccinia psidii MF-1 TaxID=1389203 RepID=A0A9Q3GIY5_9BASI|nr:hypothetical protein [Austropuccinia psidii MF-1]